MPPTMKEVAGWLRRAAMSCDAFGEHCTAEEFRQHAAQVETMAKSQLDAVTHLVEIGKACERCEWEIDKVLWCTDSHNITVRKLLSLEGLQKTEAMTCAAQVEALGELKTCDTCLYWDTSSWKILPEIGICYLPEKKNDLSQGLVYQCGPKFGCIHHEDKQ